MRCYTPSKINKSFKFDNITNLTNLTDEYAKFFLFDNNKLCHNSNFDGWFYKLCPLVSAHQVLAAKKKNEYGIEVSESWSLGARIDPLDTNPMDLYTRETNDSTSINFDKVVPLVITEDRVCILYLIYYYR